MTPEFDLVRFQHGGGRTNAVRYARTKSSINQHFPAVPLVRSAGTKGDLSPSSGRTVPINSLGVVRGTTARSEVHQKVPHG